MSASRGLLLAAARSLNVPDEELTGRSLHALVRAVLPALLVASTAAKERVAAWMAEHPDGPWELSPTAKAEMITDRLHYFGDRAMLPVVVQAVSCLNSAVCGYVLARVAILGIGRTLRGVCLPCRFVDRGGEQFEYIVVVDGRGRSDAAIRRTTLHEVGHAWLLPSPASDSRAIEEIAHDSLLALAEQESWPGLARYRESMSAEEMLAQALAACWSLLG